MTLGMMIVSVGPISIVATTTEDESDNESEPETESESEPEPEPEVEPKPESEVEQPPIVDEPVIPEPIEPIECDNGLVLNDAGDQCVPLIVEDVPPIATVEEEEEEEDDVLPYCDKVEDDPDYKGACHDRMDFDDITKLYPCNDGTQKEDWRDCEDAYVPNPNPNPSPSPNPPSCKDFPKADKCHEDRKRIIVKFIKNVDIVKKITNSERGSGGDLDIKETIVAIDYDNGAGLNCVIDEDDDGQCETFEVTKDKDKEPLLVIIPFDN